MLETKNLVKIYKPKKGVPVTALSGVSIKFPETGMVFLLGKSGSGKSTLLNVLGGLDNYNDGEIVIKGVSSKKFKQKHFDSYRNTYVGFIFQEYNVLDDFTVGANIALAIELQNRRAEDNEVNKILKEVDLEGYATRKPNELSGGQKQRVAIARALVKNPQIIMADEPTGALDSVTGKAILETLKKLSKNKLVIVVSHDREFAENYADRIIELADGVVISDIEYEGGEAPNKEEILFNGNQIDLPKGYHITEQDRKAINDYIDSLNDAKVKINIKSSNSSTRRFKPTDSAKIVSQDGSTFKLIKSKLPLKNAFKIGASGLKHKKIRLAITILLSCISFGLFGLSDTFGAYNHINTCSNSLVDTGVKYVATAKSKFIGNETNGYWRDYGYLLSQSEIDNITEQTGVKMQGVYIPPNSELGFEEQINPEVNLTDTDYSLYNPSFSGFAEISPQILEDMGFKILAGTLPDGAKNEIAISEYIFEVFKKGEYLDSVIKYDNGTVKYNYIPINTYEEIIGKKITLLGSDFIVSAVIDTNFDIERYNSLQEKKEHKTNTEKLADMLLYSEFSYSSNYSYAALAMVGSGRMESFLTNRPPMSSITEGYIVLHNDQLNVDPMYLAKLSNIKNEKILWLGDKKTELGEKEIIATTDCVMLFEDGPEGDFETREEYYRAAYKNKTDLIASIDVFQTGEFVGDGEYKLVGVIINEEPETKIASTVVCSDSLFETLSESDENVYSFCVGTMPQNKADIKELVSFCYREDSKVRYQIQNSVTYELDAINEALKILSKVFLYIGLGFALFASLMLANFIGTSISYKKQEIGILRAIGSRSNDVFRIFFAESFIIAMINFVLSATGVGVVTAIFNKVVRTEVGLLVTILNFSIRQITLLFAVSVLVAFLASFLPVKKIASKRPIDAIRNR